MPTKLCGICHKAAPGGAGIQTPQTCPLGQHSFRLPYPPVLAGRELSPPAKARELGLPHTLSRSPSLRFPERHILLPHLSPRGLHASVFTSPAAYTVQP